MCELLAISSRLPTAVSMSLDRFADHGSETSSNRDGWGIVYYADDDIRRFRDTGPAASSEWVKFVEHQELHSTLFMAHIRHANMGTVSLPNTHPFARELGGNMHTFAHNGYLEKFADCKTLAPQRFWPLGDTDSEWAFCGLLQMLCEVWRTDAEVPALAERYEIIDAFAGELRKLGVANFVYCDGDTLFIHADKRIQADGEIREPGLHLYRRSCPGGAEIVSGGGVDINSPQQSIVLAASVPLTDEGWEPLPRGTLVALKDGEPVSLQA